MEQIYQQDLSGEKTLSGGPFLIHLLFREAVEMPAKSTMLSVMKRHCGKVHCFGYSENFAGFSAEAHMAEFEDGKAPVQLMVTACIPFDETIIDPFTRGQMWDCMEEHQRILQECTHHVIGVDMLTAGLPIQERANLDMDFLEALAELYPSCTAFYFQSCGKLFPAEEVRSHKLFGLDRFIKYGVNVRFFNIQGSEDALVDTLGMGTLFLPDLQYHFHNTMDPNWVVEHAYNLASYLLMHENPIQPGDTVDGIENGVMTQKLQWICRYEEALIQPPREVLDIHMGDYAAGQRS